jgi:hypothetical protein
MEAKFKLFTYMSCLAKDGIYNPRLRELDSMTTSGSFICYPVNSKGF